MFEAFRRSSSRWHNQLYLEHEMAQGCRRKLHSTPKKYPSYNPACKLDYIVIDLVPTKVGLEDVQSAVESCFTYKLPWLDKEKFNLRYFEFFFFLLSS